MLGTFFLVNQGGGEEGKERRSWRGGLMLKTNTLLFHRSGAMKEES